MVIDEQTATVFGLTLAAGVVMARMGITLHLLVRRHPRRCAACGRGGYDHGNGHDGGG